MADLFDKDAEKSMEAVDVPPPEPTKLLPKDPKSPLEAAEYILSTIATARVGYKLLSFYAYRFKLKDSHWFFFRLFMITAFILDIGLAIVVISIAVILLIGGTYIILRGVNAWSEVIHILHYLVHRL